MGNNMVKSDGNTAILFTNAISGKVGKFSDVQQTSLSLNTNFVLYLENKSKSRNWCHQHTQKTCWDWGICYVWVTALNYTFNDLGTDLTDSAENLWPSFRNSKFHKLSLKNLWPSLFESALRGASCIFSRRPIWSPHTVHLWRHCYSSLCRTLVVFLLK